MKRVRESTISENLPPKHPESSLERVQFLETRTQIETDSVKVQDKKNECIVVVTRGPRFLVRTVAYNDRAFRKRGIKIRCALCIISEGRARYTSTDHRCFVVFSRLLRRLEFGSDWP